MSISTYRLCLKSHNKAMITIHPLSAASPGVRSRGQQLEQRSPDTPVPGHFLQLVRGDPGHSQVSRETVSPTCPECSQESPTSGTSRRHPIRCPSHLIWLLSMRRSNGSTPSPCRMTKLLNLSLTESPNTLRRKLISTTCIRDLVLSVTTHSS